MTTSVLDLLLRAGARTALMTGSDRLTYAELRSRVSRRSTELRRQGLRPENVARAAIVADNRLDVLESILAVLALDVGIVLLHPRLAAREREAAIAASCSGGVISSSGEETVLLSSVARRSEDAAGSSAGNSAGRLSGSSAGSSAEGPHVVLFTSGTTGRPKPAVLSLEALVASAEASAEHLGWRDDDRWLLSLPLAHIGGLSIVLRCIVGGRVVVGLPMRWQNACSRDRGGFQAEEIEVALRRDRVTLLSLVPTMLKRLLDLSGSRSPSEQLRAVLVGGAPLLHGLLGRAVDGGWPVLATYGLTEAASHVTLQTTGTRWSSEVGSGRPVGRTEIRIVDEQIHVRGPSVFSGYLGAPSPFLTEGWFDTQDLGCIASDGALHVLSRRTDLIITGGENVYPAEVEAVLESLLEVESALVFGVPDEEWGERVAAALVLRSGVAPRERDVEGALHDGLAPFKHPRLWAVVDDLPRTSTGKIDRARARATLVTSELRTSLFGGRAGRRTARSRDRDDERGGSGV